MHDRTEDLTYMQLKDKTIIITGSSTGLGEEIAYKVAQLRAKVALVARAEGELKTVKNNIIKKGGVAEYFICDIRELKQIRETVIKIIKKFKKIDILVNNAGIWTDEELEKNNPERRKVAFETNALGNINFTYEVLPYLKQQNRGYIFNVISTAGVVDSPSGNNIFWKVYGASKWAITGFTKALIDELRETKIKVTSFHPGGFDSKLYEKAKRPNPHNQPWMMKTKDIADIVIFILTRPDDVLIEKLIVTKK